MKRVCIAGDLCSTVWVPAFEAFVRKHFRDSFRHEVLVARRGEELEDYAEEYLRRNHIAHALLASLHRALYEELRTVRKSAVSLREYMKYAWWMRAPLWPYYREMLLWGLSRDLAWLVMERLSLVFIPTRDFIEFAAREVLHPLQSLSLYAYSRHLEGGDSRTYSWSFGLPGHMLDAIDRDEPLRFTY